MSAQNQNQEYQVLSEELARKIKEEVKKYVCRGMLCIYSYGVVHVRDYNDVVIDDRLDIKENEFAIIFLDRGRYYVFVNATVDGDIIEFMDYEKAWEEMEKMHEEAMKKLRRNPHDIAKWDAFIAEVFFTVDEALGEDP